MRSRNGSWTGSIRDLAGVLQSLRTFFRPVNHLIGTPMTALKLRPLLFLLTLSIALPAAGRSSDSEIPDSVRESLAKIVDGGTPREIRSHHISRLLAEGRPGAIEGLARILESPERPVEVRLQVVTGALIASGCPLLEEVMNLAESTREEALGAEVRSLFGATATSDVVDALRARIEDAEAGPARRRLAVELLGHTRRKDAVPILLDVWETGGNSLADEARDGFLRIVPGPFAAVAEAKAFWSEHGGKNMEEVLRILLAAERNGESTDPRLAALVAGYQRLLPVAPLEGLLDDYLGSPHFSELRRMGAERLAEYPYAKREGEDAAEAKRTAARAILDALEAESRPSVAAALIRALRAHVEEARSIDGERSYSLLVARTGSVSSEVKIEAVKGLGALGDRRAIAHLRALYEKTPPGETALLLEVLDSLERIGDGIASWVLARLQSGAGEAEVRLKLVTLAKRDPDPGGAVPVLIERLRVDEAPRVRQQIASTLGDIGAQTDDAAVFRALAEIGLRDADPSTRALSASKLGRAKNPDERIVEHLLERLTDFEKAERVKLNVTRTLLILMGRDALDHLSPFFGNDEYWKVFRSFLTLDLISKKGGEVEAAGFVRRLRELEAHGRCEEAARLVLDATDLVWEGGAARLRTEVTLDLMIALRALGEPADALAVLEAERAAFDPTGPNAVRIALLEAELLLAADRAAEAVESARALVDREGTPAEAREKARVHLARALLATGKPEEAREEASAVPADSPSGDAAKEVVREARTRIAIRDLDDPDPLKRNGAVVALSALGEAAWPALREWFDRVVADVEEANRAVQVIADVTGRELAYDPAAPEAARTAALAAARAALETR